MVISQPPGNNPSYYCRASPTLPQLLWMLPETPYVLYNTVQHQGNSHRNGAIKRLFHESDPRDHQQIISLFILSLHALALHLAVKILLQIFLYEDLSTLSYIHLSVCISLQNASRTALCYATNTIKYIIPNIWHKSSTKHKEVRPDWNDKNDNANYAPILSHGRFYQWLRLPFSKIFDQVRKI